MMEKLIIRGSCKIRDKKIFLNRKVLFQDENALIFSDFMRNAYRFFNLNYPKFFKMDNLSKLGFFAADILFMNCKVDKPEKSEEISIIITNSSSSLDTDFTFYDSIKDSANYFPSPSVFVYTLPNIMIGEICIRHKITGESAFFISEKFDQEFIFNYVQQLFELKKVQQCIAGWVELMDDKYEAVLYFVEKKEDITDENVKFEPENILDRYIN